MTSAKTWRPGALGALVDELERALGELDARLAPLDEEAASRPRRLPGSSETLTVMDVLEHVCHSQHVYDELLRVAFGLPGRPWQAPVRTLAGLCARLGTLAAACWELLEDKADWSDEQVEGTRIRAHWGTAYDLEQLLEHAVTHVLRHRRQLERLLEAEGAPAEGPLQAYSASAECYDRIYGFKDYAGEAARLIALVEERLPEARTLLDVACGTGRHLEHLRERFACEGLDLSPAQLEEARRQLPGLAFHQGDMRDVALGRTFDVVCCLFSAIGYMTTLADLARACATLARHTRPGGLVVVEPWLEPQVWQVGKVHGLFIDEPELKIARVNTSLRLDRLAVLDLHHLVGTPAGTRHILERHELLLATRDELRAALEDAGLEAEYIEGGLSGRGLWIGRRIV
jgi:SAM-dependent methyltransferase/uncharacterized damage-inducible protein DinB